MAVFQGTAGPDNLQGGAENDVLIGEAGNDTLNGGAGADTMLGGAGADTYFVDNAGDVVTETAGNGTDLVNTSISYALGANVENLTGTGAAGLSLTGNGLANLITGTSGGDAIYGGADDLVDTLVGGQGNDTYIVREGADDQIVEVGDNDLFGTVGGTDTVVVVASQTRTSYELDTGVAVENLIASDAASTLELDLYGNAFVQTIVGNAGNNELWDNFNTGTAGDTLIGLGGDDTYYVSSLNTSVVEAAGGGNDTISLFEAPSGSYTFSGEIETIDASGVSATLNLTGGTSAQTINGSFDTGNRLNGGGGRDTLNGGSGSDTFTVDSLDDVVNDTGGAVDRVIAGSSYALATDSGIEYLTAAGTTLSTFAGQGDGTRNLNALNTTVTSNYYVGDTATSQYIFGDAGGNIVNGRTGTGAGGAVDTLIGGNGNDTYRVYDQGDVVIEDTNGGAQDFIYTNVSYDLSANDTTAQAVTFQDDTVSGTITPAPVTRSVSAYINAPMQIEVLSAADQAQGTAGTASINLTGNAYGQIIIGNYGDNVISDGGSVIGTTQYQDQLAGLRGNDTYNVTAQNTTVNENVGEGTDVVNVNLDDALTSFFGLIDAAEVEYVVATGSEAISLQGNQFNQVIFGNAEVNTIDGNGGQDTLIGGAGGDSYVVTAANAANVSIIEVAGDEGVDRVVTSVSFDLGATNASYVDTTGTTVEAGGIVDIEQIVVANGSGTEAINLTGNGAQQILVGNLGANILNGDNDTVDEDGVAIGTADGDTLVGLGGDDIYRVYSQNDVVREVGGQGNDAVFTSADYQLRVGNSIETLSAADQTSTTGLELIGNEFAQAVIGTDGSDAIWGGNGNDTLTGRGGSDIFGFNETGAGAADIIADFAPGDFIGLSSSTFDFGGSFEQNEFVAGTQATGANAQVVYNQATGQLFYDADGTGIGAAALFATITPGTALGFNDFQVIAPPPATPAAA